MWVQDTYETYSTLVCSFSKLKHNNVMGSTLTEYSVEGYWDL